MNSYCVLWPMIVLDLEGNILNVPEEPGNIMVSLRNSYANANDTITVSDMITIAVTIT